MKAEIKEKWVSELRSRSAEQGIGYLHYKNNSGKEKFCALGILCDIAEKEGVITSHLSRFPDVWKYGAENKISIAPREVREWAGLDEDYGAQSMVIAKNDRGIPFAAIADWIEREL